MIDLKLKEEDKPIECKGLFWRAVENTYLSAHKSVEVRKSLRLLKKKSCKGCPHCEWFWDFLHEDIQERPPGEYLPELTTGDIYTFNLVTSQGYYDIYAEVEYLEFIKVKDD